MTFRTGRSRGDIFSSVDPEPGHLFRYPFAWWWFNYSSKKVLWIYFRTANPWNSSPIIAHMGDISAYLGSNKKKPVPTLDAVLDIIGVV
jgi:hypothetical protein